MKTKKRINQKLEEALKLQKEKHLSLEQFLEKFGYKLLSEDSEANKAVIEYFKNKLEQFRRAESIFERRNNTLYINGVALEFVEDRAIMAVHLTQFALDSKLEPEVLIYLYNLAHKLSGGTDINRIIEIFRSLLIENKIGFYQH